MKTFAYILSPISIKQLKTLCPVLKIIPDFIVKSNLKNNSPFKASYFQKVKSIKGKEIQGFLIVCPLLPQQMLELDENFVLDKITAAGNIAKHLGAKMIGLGGYTAIVADKGLSMAKKLSVPVTTGKALIAWSAFESIFRVARAKKIPLEKTSLAIIGAGGSLGYLCAAKFSGYIPKMILADGKREKLYQSKEKILTQNQVEITIEDNVHNAVKNADIIINAARSPKALFGLDEVKSGAIICDISASWNIADTHNGFSRQDVTIIKGGLIKVPNTAGNLIHASLAETMLLTLESRFTSYSLGDNINLDKLEEIADLAVRHGFEVWVPQAPVL